MPVELVRARRSESVMLDRLPRALLVFGLALSGCGGREVFVVEDAAERDGAATATATAPARDRPSPVPAMETETATVTSERGRGAEAFVGEVGGLHASTARWATWPRPHDGTAPPVVEEPPPVVEEPPPVVDEPPPVVEEPPPPPDPDAGSGPKPTSTCAITKNASGFFVRTSSQSSYAAYVPASYDGTRPMRLVVGLHGCGDSAMNFATWGVNPYPTRAIQDHIGISIGGRDGACWTLGTDDAKVLAAIDDISTCFWVHAKRVTIAGFSSGGLLAYRLGLTQAGRFAGILIENSGLYGTGADPDTMLAGAAWRLNIAHRAHTGDTVFPLAKVRADWAKITTAGFPLATSETAGGHDGTSDDWALWLIPQSKSWSAP